MYEQRIGRLAPALAALAVLDDDRFEMVCSLDAHHLTQDFDPDVSFILELGDQVVRHAGRQRWASHEERDGARIVGEEHRRLAGGVAAADQENVAAARVQGLGPGRAVIDSAADHRVGADDLELAPDDAGRDDDRSGIDAVTAVEPYCQLFTVGIGIDADDVARDHDFDAEPRCLPEGAVAQLVARDAGRKTEVVLDPRRGASLSSWRLALDQQCAQALGGPVNGSRESTSAGPPPMIIRS